MRNEQNRQHPNEIKTKINHLPYDQLIQGLELLNQKYEGDHPHLPKYQEIERINILLQL